MLVRKDMDVMKMRDNLTLHKLNKRNNAFIPVLLFSHNWVLEQ